MACPRSKILAALRDHRHHLPARPGKCWPAYISSRKRKEQASLPQMAIHPLHLQPAWRQSACPWLSTLFPGQANSTPMTAMVRSAQQPALPALWNIMSEYVPVQWQAYPLTIWILYQAPTAKAAWLLWQFRAWSKRTCIAPWPRPGTRGIGSAGSR